LMEIISDILDFSKIEEGRLELNIEQTDLVELSHQVINLFKYQANSKNIILKLNIDSEVPQFILTDSVRLKQIIVNLIGNALKFTSAGEIQLNIQVDSITEEFATLNFSVKDTGIGIKGNNQDKIFNSFAQEDANTSREFGGTGLGLTISNQLLGLMNSKLHLESQYGQGSNFYFSIRFRIAKMEKTNEILPENTIKKPTFESISTHKQLHILIAEDNEINMLLVKKILKNMLPNSIVYEASNGNEAVKIYQNHPLDVIFMDVQMPKENGYEATAKIRKMVDAHKTTIIALTAGILKEEKQKCLASGMDDYLSKPINPEDLQKVLQHWVSRKKL
jgi:CheY-like chemotaxis protein